MKHRNLIFLLLAAVSIVLASCGREPAPTFMFESYQQEFDTKQPFKVDMSYIRITNADRSHVLKSIEESNRRAFLHRGYLAAHHAQDVRYGCGEVPRRE